MVAYIGARRFSFDRTDGFTVASIDQNIPYMPQFETSFDNPGNVKELLSQTFTFYGRGGQAYVFLGEDKKTILKFFKKTHIVPEAAITLFDALIPPPFRHYRIRLIENRTERFKSIFSSCQMAYKTLRSETGMIYLHLNPQDVGLETVTVTDRLGIHHQIPLKTTSFLLQKKAQLICTKLDRLLQKGDVDGAKKSIHSLISYLKHRCELGIRDTDNALKRNYGYLDEKAISVDTGSFRSDETLKTPKAMRKEVTRKTRQLRKWLRKYHADLLPFYEEEIDKINQA